MIEAVNSVLSNVSANRGAIEQQTATRNLAANPNKIQEAAEPKPYVSSAISIDKGSNKAVIQVRDTDTGDVVRQFPTEGQLKAYRQAQEFSERQRADSNNQVREANGAEPSQETSSADLPDTSAPESSAPVQSSAPAPSAAPVSVETEA